MRDASTLPTMTVEEYFRFEERSPIKHEYVAGELYAMSGATARHNRIPHLPVDGRRRIGVVSEVDGREYSCGRASIRCHASRPASPSSAHVRLLPPRRGSYRMAMPAQSTEWTVEMVRALPDDGNRYEVIDGELFVTPAPSMVHQRAVVELLHLVDPYVKAHGIGETLIAPADVVVYGPRKFVQPDLFVVPLVDGAPMRAWTEVGRLLLAVEVISPSTRWTDRGRKRALYREKGVPDYWIIDTDERTAEWAHPDDSPVERLVESLLWQPDREVPPLAIDLPAYFDRVNGVA